MLPSRDGANCRLLLLIIFYVIYLFIGAAVFDAVEKPHEEQMTHELNEFIQQFIRRHNSCLSEKSLNDFIQEISLGNDKGIPATNNVTREPNWSFGQSVFYATTVLTTIGYGNVSPLTRLGKFFLLIFSIIGLPVTLLLLYAIIERLMHYTTIMLDCFTEKTLQITNNVPALSQRVKRSDLHVIFVLFMAVVVLVGMIIVPAMIYAYIEDWAFLDAFYYCFISLSTVGLGDYIPGDSDHQEHRHFYKICSTVYLLVGVTVMVWMLEIFSEVPEFNFYKYFTLAENGILTNHHSQIHDQEAKENEGEVTRNYRMESSFDNKIIIQDEKVTEEYSLE